MLIENKNVFKKNCVYVCVTQNDEGKKSILLYLLKECIYMIIYMIIFIVDNNELFLREGMS